MSLDAQEAQQGQEGPDTLFLKSGEVIKGTVMGTLPNGSVNFKFSQGTLPYPKNSIQKVDLAERPALKEAQDAVAAGNADEAIQILTPVVDKFLAIQTPWVGQAASELASVLAENGQTFKARELAKRISEYYPGSPIGTILEANTLISEGKAGEAIQKLNAIKEKLPVKTAPSPSEMQLLGSYHFTLARAFELQKQLDQALEHYLIVSAVYPLPQQRANDAQQKADALVAANAKLMVR